LCFVLFASGVRRLTVPTLAFNMRSELECLIVV
jgi:hypothetical protein